MGWAIAGIITAIVSTAISTYAAYSQSQVQQQAAKAEGKFREQEAESARQSAAYEETQYRRRLALLLGKQGAIAGASGLDITSGSPLTMELDNARQGELEALNVKRTGDVGASAREFEARMARQRAVFAGQSGGFALAGGITSGASSILGSWSKYQNRTMGTWNPSQGSYL